MSGMNERGADRLGVFLWRVLACHTVTYFAAGLFAYLLLDYRGLFLSPALACFMRPVDSPAVALGPALQVVRGLIFGLALHPFRHVFLDRAGGWRPLWGLLVGLSILSPVGPAPGSVEGFIYTQVPPLDQVRGWLEVFPQTLAFSLLLVSWSRRPGRALNIVMLVAAVLIVVLSAFGWLAARSQGSPL